MTELLRIEQQWPRQDGRTYFVVEERQDSTYLDGAWLNVKASSPGVVYGASSLPSMDKETAAAVGKALTEWAERQ